jgi:hypothetical protein
MLTGGRLRPRQGDLVKTCVLPDVDRRTETRRTQAPRGFSVLVFLIVYAGLLRLVKKKIWPRAEAKAGHD